MNALRRSKGLRTITELADEAGRCRRSLLRLLGALHRRDLEAGHDGNWLLRPGAQKLLVNVDRLYRAHPALFETRYASREEFEDHEERLIELAAGLSENRKRVNAVAAKLRERSQEKRVA